MASSCPHIQATPITKDYPALFGDSYETDATYEHTPLLDAFFYPCPDFDTISPLEEAVCERQQLPSSGNGNWLSDYDSCFGGSWGDSFFSYSHDSDINGSGGNMVKTEDDDQMHAQSESDFRYCEDNENQPTFDYDYGSWFNYTESEQEDRPAYSYGLDEMRFCEGIFGYWPCVYREVQQAYV